MGKWIIIKKDNNKIKKKNNSYENILKIVTDTNSSKNMKKRSFDMSVT